MNGYDLSRKWFDFCFENPDKISPNHTAMYFFIIEHCNRLGWKEKFGLPTSMVKDAIGIRNFRTYKNTLNDLVDFGFIKMIEISKNQYSSNIIAIADFTKAYTKAGTKALDKALQKHSQKHCKSIASINKQITNNKEQILERENKFKENVFEFEKEYSKELLDKFFNHWSQHGEKDKKMLFEKQKSFEIKKRLITWFNNSIEYERKNRRDNKFDAKGDYNAGKEKDYSIKL